jgi:hypothetical protein
MRNSIDQTTKWLLDGDPAIRWQTLRDITSERGALVDQERRRVESEGWGARLLAKQDPTGTWAGGLYTPKWTSTTYTLLMLRDFGLEQTNRQAREGCKLLLEGGLQPDGGINYGDGANRSRQGEACVSGMVLSLLAYFRLKDERQHSIAGYLLDQQLADGGWNCRRPSGATHSSVNTTISVLEGLRHYELTLPVRVGEIRRAQRLGREFLLAHRLFRSHRTGNIIKSEFTRFSFPPRWHYDILRALDYFKTVNAPRDPRLTEAVEIVRTRRREDGRWLLPAGYKGHTFFELEKAGKPSRWNTLRAMRVLRWWDDG